MAFETNFMKYENQILIRKVILFSCIIRRSYFDMPKLLIRVSIIDKKKKVEVHYKKLDLATRVAVTINSCGAALAPSNFSFTIAFKPPCQHRSKFEHVS